MYGGSKGLKCGLGSQENGFWTCLIKGGEVWHQGSKKIEMNTLGRFTRLVTAPILYHSSFVDWRGKHIDGIIKTEKLLLTRSQAIFD